MTAMEKIFPGADIPIYAVNACAPSKRKAKAWLDRPSAVVAQPSGLKVYPNPASRRNCADSSGGVGLM
jgi:hypothetical protein